MARIVELKQETIPAGTLVGKVYHAEDRDAHGSYGAKWGEWFAGGWFERLAELGRPTHGGDYLGAMRMKGDTFEYWIGMLLEPTAALPEGFSSVELPGGSYAVAWIQGPDGPELYGMHEECMRLAAERGWKPARDAWYVERYNCPRFTKPNEKGEVILDYLVTLEE